MSYWRFEQNDLLLKHFHAENDLERRKLVEDVADYVYEALGGDWPTFVVMHKNGAPILCRKLTLIRARDGCHLLCQNSIGDSDFGMSMMDVIEIKVKA